MIDTNWDVDSYKTEHESDEHWELRRKFLVTHKDTLPEDDLVCMAQVFTNIEFLGCRYPNETMIRVAELAKGVVEEFREKKKGTLKRTFVAASDAASSKVKGLGRRGETQEEMGNAKRAKPMKFVAAAEPEMPAVATPILTNQLAATNQSNASPYPAHSDQFDSPSVEHPWEDAASATPRRLRPLAGPLAKFVVVLVPDGNPFQMLDRAVQTNRFQNNTKYDTKALDNGLFECKFILQNVELSKAVAVDRKAARDLAACTALEKLRQQCYSVIVKKNPLTGQSVEQSDLGVDKPGHALAEQRLSADNVGSKLMRMMGWTGGGLGSAAQGRVEPVQAAATVRRAGLGVDAGAGGVGFRRAVRAYMQQWLARGATPDLLFSTDFDKEQRKIAHEVARTLGLKSQSYGAEGDRRLVVSKKLSLWDVVEELALSGGVSDKYELLEPGAPLPPTYNPPPPGQA